MEILLLLFIAVLTVYELFRLMEYVIYVIHRSEGADVLYKIKDFKEKTKYKLFLSSDIGIFSTLSLVLLIWIWSLISFATQGVEFMNVMLLFSTFYLFNVVLKESTETVRGSAVCKMGLSFGVTFTKWHRIKKVEKRLVESSITDKSIAMIKVTYHNVLMPSFSIITGRDTDNILKVISERNSEGFMSIVIEENDKV